MMVTGKSHSADTEFNMDNNDNTTSPGTICYEAHGNLYLNITNRCNACCTFCLRELSDGVYGYNLKLSREPTLEEIIAELEKFDLKKYHEFVFTGFGEATIRLDEMLEVTRWLKEQGMQVRLDTNGLVQLMYPDRDVVAEMREAGIDAVSVSLNAESEELYNSLCRPIYKNAYSSVIEFTKAAKEAGIRTRMTVVDLPEIDVEKCERIARDIGADFYAR